MLYEIEMDITAFTHITKAKVHEQRAMDLIPDEQGG